MGDWRPAMPARVRRRGSVSSGRVLCSDAGRGCDCDCCEWLGSPAAVQPPGAVPSALRPLSNEAPLSGRAREAGFGHRPGSARSVLEVAG